MSDGREKSLKAPGLPRHEAIGSTTSPMSMPVSHRLGPPGMAPPDFDSLYRDHFEFVYRVARRLGGPGFDAEDAAQEVFVVVSNKLDRFDGSARITTWLFAITLNVVRSQRRRQRLRRLFERRRVEEPPILESVDRAEVRDARRILDEVLEKLAPKKREVFVLAELEELSCEEIAAIVGAKTETVWSRLHYARAEFAERLHKHKDVRR